jgi:hypothetical protein
LNPKLDAALFADFQEGKTPKLAVNKSTWYPKRWSITAINELSLPPL